MRTSVWWHQFCLRFNESLNTLSQSQKHKSIVITETETLFLAGSADCVCGPSAWPRVCSVWCAVCAQSQYLEYLGQAAPSPAASVCEAGWGRAGGGYCQTVFCCKWPRHGQLEPASGAASAASISYCRGWASHWLLTIMRDRSSNPINVTLCRHQTERHPSHCLFVIVYFL